MSTKTPCCSITRPTASANWTTSCRAGGCGCSTSPSSSPSSTWSTTMSLGTGDLMAAEYTKEMEVGDALKGGRDGEVRSRAWPRCNRSQDPAVLADGKQTFDHVVRALPPAGRRRLGRPEPDRRLLDSRLATSRTTSRPSGTACRPRAWSPGRACSSRTRSTPWPATSTPCAARIRPIPSRRRTRPRSRPGPASLNSRHLRADRHPRLERSPALCRRHAD